MPSPWSSTALFSARGQRKLNFAAILSPAFVWTETACPLLAIDNTQATMIHRRGKRPATPWIPVSEVPEEEPSKRKRTDWSGWISRWLVLWIVLGGIIKGSQIVSLQQRDCGRSLEGNKSYNNTTRISSSKTSVKYEFIEKYNALERRNKASSHASASSTSGPQPYSGPARVFPVYPHEFPCAKSDGVSRGPTTEGFLYIKEMKTASTTLAGVTLRICRNVAQRKYRRDPNQNPCRARYFHLRARIFVNRNRSKSFLWTMLRDPNERMVSKFFHIAVSRENYSPTLDDFVKYYHTYKTWIMDQAYYLKTLGLKKVHPRDPEYYVNETMETLQGFDFIGITERLDESLVVLQLLLGLETGDLLYIDSKMSGSFEFIPKTHQCHYITPKFTTSEWRKYLSSDEWEKYTKADTLFYQAANKSLDLTIDALGRNVVDRNIQKLQFAQALAQERCGDVGAACNEDGELQQPHANCLYQDAGCGYQCLDQVAQELSQLKAFQAMG